MRRRNRNLLIATLIIFIDCLLRQVALGSPFFVPQTLSGGTGRNIRHFPCVSRRTGETGICMFALTCAKANGTHLGTCVDGFYFGSCCKINDEPDVFPQDNSIETDGPAPALPSSQVPVTTTGTSLPFESNDIPGNVDNLKFSSHSSTTVTMRMPTTTTTTMKASSNPTKGTNEPPNKPKPSKIATKKPVIVELTTETTKLTTFQSVQMNVSQQKPPISSVSSSTSLPTRKTPKPSSSAAAKPTATLRPKPSSSSSSSHAATKLTSSAVAATTTGTTAARPQSIGTTMPTSHRNVSDYHTTVTSSSTSKTAPVDATPKPSVFADNKATSATRFPPRNATTKAPTSATSDKRQQIVTTTLGPTRPNHSPPATKKPSTTKKPSRITTKKPAHSTIVKKPPANATAPNAASTSSTTKITTVTTTTTTAAASPVTGSTSAALNADRNVTSASSHGTTNLPTSTRPVNGNAATAATTAKRPVSSSSSSSSSSPYHKKPSSPATTKRPASTASSSKRPSTTSTHPKKNVTSTLTAMLQSSSSSNPPTKVTSLVTSTLSTPTVHNVTTPSQAVSHKTTTDSSTTTATTSSRTPVASPTSPSTVLTPPSLPSTAEFSKLSTANTGSTQSLSIPMTMPSSSSTSAPVHSSTKNASQQVNVETSPMTPVSGIVTWTSLLNEVESDTKTTRPDNSTETPSAEFTETEWTPVTTPDGWIIIHSPTTKKPESAAEVPEFEAKPTSTPLVPTKPVMEVTHPSSTTQRISVTTQPTTYMDKLSTLATVTVSPEFTDNSLVPMNMSNYKEVCGRRLFPDSRIVGGDGSTFGKWPWQISLRQWRTSTYLHKCGAALLNENWAITAAHCVQNVLPSDLLLRIGEHDLVNEKEPYAFQERRVQIVASHPNFDPRTFEFDLALMRFYEPVLPFQPNVLPICIPDDDEDYVGQTAYVTGWGRLYEDGPLPSVLQEVAVPVINNTVCENMYRNAGYIEHIPQIFICAGWRKGGFDSCEGDSGGPLVIQRKRDGRWILAGVISWGIGCAEPNQPGVYTRISEFREWVNQILQF